MTDFELEDTTEIAVADNPVGGLNLLITVVLTAICLFYFVTERTRPDPEPAQVASEAVTSESK